MIPIPHKHPDVIARHAAVKDLSNDGATLAEKKRVLNDATQQFMGQKAAQRSKVDLEADKVLSATGHRADWITPEKLEELTREVEIWERVVQRRRDTVNNRAKYSAAICEQKDVQERYIAIQKRIATACAELAEANAAEVEFFDQLTAVGVSPCFRPMRVAAVGLPTDPNSVASFHRKEVETYCPEAQA
jgi:hypothetical protein